MRKKEGKNIQNTDQDAAKLRERGNRLDMIEKNII